MNGEQGLVIGVGSRWRPVEGLGDHGAVVDHSELVWLGSKRVAAAWFLRSQKWI